MLTVLQILLFAVLALVLWKGIALGMQIRRRRSKSDLICETCRFCEAIDGDGVMCRYGDTVTLKTRANVRMCQDYLPAEGSSRNRRRTPQEGRRR